MERPFKIEVHSYSGYKAGETPRRFTLGAKTYEIDLVMDRWYGPDYSYFKVRTVGGPVFILKYSDHSGGWDLEFYKGRPPDDSPHSPPAGLPHHNA